MKPSQIIALDLSLTSTGICTGGITQTLTTKLRGVERLAYYEGVIKNITTAPPRLVVIEGYAYAMANQAHQVGELGGVVRLALFRAGVPYVEVAPAKLKKFATGKGNAKKDDMIEAAIRRFGFTGHGNDEADAYLLWCLAVTGYGMAREPTKAMLEVAASVDWPEVGA